MHRRSFLKLAGAAAAAATLSSTVGARRAFGSPTFKARRVIVVAIAGGLRLRESLGMGEGATMPNLFGHVPLVKGFGAGPAGAPKIAPEYAKTASPLVLPKTRATPLFDEGALVANLRYADGSPGHLQGSATLVSGIYNNLDNSPTARAPGPTLFEMHRRKNNAAATDAWYVSVLGGFYRGLAASDHPDYGAAFAGAWMSPPALMNPLVPIVTSGDRDLELATADAKLPTIGDDAASIRAVRKLRAVMDGGRPAFGDAQGFPASAADQDAIEGYLASVYGDATYDSFYPSSFGIGLDDGGRLSSTPDGQTTFHAERILSKWKSRLMVLNLFDIDTCHGDFNGYLRSQSLADACVAHLWDFIQSTDGLKDETAMIVLPEHGRQLDFNGKATDSLGRSGLDHGSGDDGDRDVWALALGPDFKPGVYEPTDVKQHGRHGGRPETIDVVRTAAGILGLGDEMDANLKSLGQRPGLLLEGILR